MAKLQVGLLFGGRSVEHEVSISSASSILRALDPNRYDVSLLAVDHGGRWRSVSAGFETLDEIEGAEVHLPAVPGARSLLFEDGSPATPALDVIFPIVHGSGGEDGSLQGLLELCGIAYVGSGVLGSSLQMDKVVSKQLLTAAGLPVLPGRCVDTRELGGSQEALAKSIEEELGLPLFVKPAHLGSSVGISRVTRSAELLPALLEAARYDSRILAERGIDARDLEVALLDRDPVEASVPGEIRTDRPFYDYEAKYVDEGTELLVPAPVSEKLAEALAEAALVAFRALEGEGLGRVDFLLDRNSDEFFVNEVNSLPGFTEASMYPRLWEASGLPYPALLDRLIEVAIERQHRQARLETQYRRL